MDPVLQLPLPRVLIHNVGVAHLTDWSHATPSRSHWRFYYNSSPGATIVHGRRLIPLRPPTAVLIPPDTPIDRTLMRPVESLHVHFSAGYPYDELSGDVFTLEVKGWARGRIDELKGRIRARGGLAASDHAACVTLNAVVANALCAVAPDLWPERDVDGRIRAAIRYMEENLHQPATNLDLAGMCSLSESAFNHLFKEETGESPQDFWRNLRLQRVSILLQRTSDSIEWIAEQTGFCDRFYMSKCFKKRYGMGPAAYRRAVGAEGRPASA